MAHRKRLSLKEKLNIINESDSGTTLGQLAIKYKLNKSSLHGIKKNKNKILRNLNFAN